MLRIRLAGSDVVLHPSGAALLSGDQTLLVADAHFGKAVSFRKLGVPVPSGTTTETLDGLTAAVAATRARRVVSWGISCTRATPVPRACSARWRAAHGRLELTLVRGNHDDRAGGPPAFGDDTGALPQHALGVLPAFGSFTGMHRIAPRAGDRIFPVANDVVRAIPVLPIA